MGAPAIQLDPRRIDAALANAEARRREALVSLRIAWLSQPIALRWHQPTTHEAMRRDTWSREREASHCNYTVAVVPDGDGWAWSLRCGDVLVRGGHEDRKRDTKAAAAAALERAVRAELAQLRGEAA